MNEGIPFFKTAMGRDFYDHNVPAMLKQLTRLNDNLERLITLETLKLQEKKVEKDDH